MNMCISSLNGLLNIFNIALMYFQVSSDFTVQLIKLVFLVSLLMKIEVFCAFTNQIVSECLSGQGPARLPSNVVVGRIGPTVCAVCDRRILAARWRDKP